MNETKKIVRWHVNLFLTKYETDDIKFSYEKKTLDINLSAESVEDLEKKLVELKKVIKISENEL